MPPKFGAIKEADPGLAFRALQAQHVERDDDYGKLSAADACAVVFVGRVEEEIPGW